MLQQEDVVRETEVALGEVGVGRAVEEEVRRSRDPDRAPAVYAEALDGRGLARDLAVVLRREIAPELADLVGVVLFSPSRESRSRACVIVARLLQQAVAA